MSFISEHENSYLEIASTDWMPIIEVVFRKIKGKEKSPQKINIDNFTSIKGIKALGKRLTNEKVKMINILESIPLKEKESEASNNSSTKDINDSPNQVKIDFE